MYLQVHYLYMGWIRGHQAQCRLLGSNNAYRVITKDCSPTRLSCQNDFNLQYFSYEPNDVSVD